MSTLKEVARHANVSKSTVSRAFNNPEKVKSSTLIEVREAAEKLGYRPSRVARRLRMSGKAKILGLIIPDIQNPFFADLVRGVEDEAYANEFALILNNSDEDPERQKLCLDTLRRESVDGVIVPPVQDDDEAVSAFVKRGIPVVCVDRQMKGEAVDSIVSDNRFGAYTATKHLIDHGYRRIGYVGGIPKISTSRERRDGYRQALNEHDLAFNPDVIREGDSRQESGRRLTEELLAMDEPPEALFTGNNLITLGAFVACHTKGIHIPNDLAIVGYDDVPWALAMAPPPTVISQSGYEMGRRAAQILLRRIRESNGSPSTVMLRPKLIVRGSCGVSHNDDDPTSARIKQFTE